MPAQVPPPGCPGPAPAGRVPAFLLTGASGVVGSALRRRLRGADVTCLVHRRPVAGPGAVTVRGDVTDSMLGLSAADRAALVRKVTAVIHCAACTGFTGDRHEAVNVAGTRHAAAFAAEAGAVLYHVSTAFHGVTSDTGAARYAASKNAAEQAARDGGARHVIIRPSVVIGDSATGETAAFQGLHKVAAMIAAGAPVIPLDKSWTVDYVPADVVADAIACLAENRVGQGEYWVTAGDAALRLDEAAAVIAEVTGARTPLFVRPGAAGRLLIRALLLTQPPRARRDVRQALDLFAPYLQQGQALPSSLGDLAAAGAMPLPDQRESLRNSIRYWAARKAAPRLAAAAVAGTPRGGRPPPETKRGAIACRHQPGTARHAGLCPAGTCLPPVPARGRRTGGQGDDKTGRNQ
jgi:nucleoside-diphosphate-sugar epimerase